MPCLPTRTRLVLVRHVKEAWKSTNTARLALLALPNSELHPFGGKQAALDLEAICRPGTWLLFPDSQGEPEGPAPDRLVVLDGSWGQARRMLLRHLPLRQLPRLSLPPPMPAERLRRPPRADAMATLEAVAYAFGRLEGSPVQQALLELHAQMVQRVLASRGRLPAAGSPPANGQPP